MILDDKQIVFNQFFASCRYCKHFVNYEYKCKAFHNGIPDEILNGENDHSKPLSDQDNKIVFEPLDKSQ